MRNPFKNMWDSLVCRGRTTYLIRLEERHTLCLDVTKASKASFHALAAHMGVTHEEAMLEALNDWVARNAEIYDYIPSHTEEVS